MNERGSNVPRRLIAILALAGLALIVLLLQGCDNDGDDSGSGQTTTCECDLIGPESESQGLNSVQVSANTCVDQPCETNVSLDILGTNQLTSQQAQALADKGQLYSDVLDIQPDDHSWDPPIEVQFALIEPAPKDEFEVTIFQWRTSIQDWSQAGIAVAENQGDTLAVGTISHTSLFALVDTAAEPPAVEAPVAEFDAEPRRGGCQFEVQFVNLSSGGETFVWDFGDGATSDEPEPLHVYTRDGEGTRSYTVTLVVGGPGGQARETKVDFIQSQCIQ